MAVIEQEQVTTEQPSERAVFVASDGRRARRLRRVAFAATFLACLWLVGLALGMLGFGNLPGVSLAKQPFGVIAPDSSDRPRAERADVAPVVRRSDRVEKRIVAGAQERRVVGAKAVAKARPVRPRPVSRPPAGQVTPPAPVAQQPLNPAQRPRGWTRRGAAAPPGQARQATPPPPPGTRGQRRGQTPPTTPPPAPPGQEKKALLPPPPPPPKKA